MHWALDQDSQPGNRYQSSWVTTFDLCGLLPQPTLDGSVLDLLIWRTGWDPRLIWHPDHVPPSLYPASKASSSTLPQPHIASDSKKYMAEVIRKQLWAWKSQGSAAKRGLEENGRRRLVAVTLARAPQEGSMTFPEWRA